MYIIILQLNGSWVTPKFCNSNLKLQSRKMKLELKLQNSKLTLKKKNSNFIENSIFTFCSFSKFSVVSLQNKIIKFCEKKFSRTISKNLCEVHNLSFEVSIESFITQLTKFQIRVSKHMCTCLIIKLEYDPGR